MSSLLSTPVFVSGPDDDLATVDLYKASGELINETRDISEVFKAEELDAVKGGVEITAKEKADIIKQFAEDGKAIKADSDSLVKGLLASAPGMIGALRSLPSKMQGDLIKVNGLAEIIGTFNGNKANISKASLATINGLSSLINGIAKTNLPYDFSDNKSLAQFSASLIIQATKVGIPGVFKPYIAAIKNKKVQRAVIGSLATQVVNNSMTELLSDMSSSATSRILTKVAGGLALKYIRNYTNPVKSSTQKKYENYLLTRTALDAVLDEWIKYYRPGGGAYEGSYMTTGSGDFIAAVLLAAKYQTKWIIPTNPGLINTAAGTSAEAYIALITRNLNMTAKNALKKDFPLVYLK